MLVEELFCVEVKVLFTILLAQSEPKDVHGVPTHVAMDTSKVMRFRLKLLTKSKY